MRLQGIRFRLPSALLGVLCVGLPVVATAESGSATAPGAAPATAASATAASATAAPATKSTFSAAAPTDVAAIAKPAPNAPAATPGDPWTPSSEARGATSSPNDVTPPVYYVEQVPAPTDADAADSGKSEPARSESRTTTKPRRASPPPSSIRLGIEEPPPPPVVRHRAPRTALWLGARVGWWVPFGDLWGSCNASGYGCSATHFSDVASSGPMMELDVGGRFGRNYSVYVLWERAQLGAGDGLYSDYEQRRAETDYLAVGLRLSSNPDDVGMVLDLALGARRFVAKYRGGNELQLTDAPLETRLGVGADIRIGSRFTLSPMVTLGLGAFGQAEWVTKDTIADALPSGEDALTHGWATLQLGGHFDLWGSD